MRITVREAALLVGGEVRGDAECEVTGASGIEEALPGDIVFAEAPRYLKSAMESSASAIVGPLDSADTDKPLILVKDPKLAFARILEVFAQRPQVEPGIHNSVSIGADFQSGRNLSVQYGCYIGNNVTIGDDVVIHPSVYIGDDVKIGSGVTIYPMAAVLGQSVIGDRVRIHSGAVIGSDGFGYVMVDGKHTKIPQIGNVVVGDDVEIGSNVAIDRARTGSTEIGSGSKIDNLVHIAHNVKIGRNCLIIAQAGIAGSVVLGDGVIMAGQSGVKDHVIIGDGTVVAARAGVIGDLPGGMRVSGFPARSHCDQMRMLAALQHAPELLKAIGRLEQRISILEQSKDSGSDD